MYLVLFELPINCMSLPGENIAHLAGRGTKAKRVKRREKDLVSRAIQLKKLHTKMTGKKRKVKPLSNLHALRFIDVVSVC